ncbi:MAG: hypothetical protein ACRC8S_18975 [Fimbriiglobus sp.]
MLRRRRKLILGCVLVLAAAIGVVWWSASSSPPPFQIREDITFITGPVDADGFLDFEVALHDRLKVPPQENANVLLWQAIGPRPDGTALHPDYWAALGVPEPPLTGPYFTGLATWKNDGRILTVASKEMLNLESRAYFGRWYIEDEATITLWLKSQTAPLELVRQASLKPRYYNPVIARNPTSGQKEPLGGRLLPNVKTLRSIASALSVRARLSIMAGDFESAWTDAMTLQRLTALMSHSESLIEKAFVLAMHVTACHIMAEVLDAAPWSEAELRARQLEWESISPWRPIVDNIHVSQRMMALSLLEWIRRDRKFDENEWLGPKGTRRIFTTKEIDWNITYRDTNAVYDKITEISKLQDAKKREVEFQALMKEVDSAAGQNQPGNAVARFLDRTFPPAIDAKSLAGKLATVTMPGLDRFMTDSDGREMMTDMVRTSFALARYRRVLGQYPMTLSDLKPKFIEKMPIDIHTGQDLVYTLTEKGYRLYSLGDKKVDQGGPGVKSQNIGFALPRPRPTAQSPTQPEPMPE